LDNDVNALVLAEKNFGEFYDYENLMYVTVGEGIGVVIFLNGSIFRGHNGGAGEFGHISIDHRGKPYDCGNIGCLEEYISWPTIYSKIVASIAKRKPTKILSLVNGDLNSVTPIVFRESLEANDPLAIEIIEDVSSYLGAGIVSLVNLFNPHGIILGGELAQNNPLLHKRVKEIISNQGLKHLTKGIEIRSASLGENFDLVGTAEVLLKDIFNFSI
jgi:predicted NBD/HSP70 family sugar kinase